MLHRGQRGPGPDLDAALDGVDIAYGTKPLGGQQHVVVLRNGARHQRGAAALHGDVRPGVAAHPQHLGDLLGRTRPHQRAGVAAIAAGVVDAAAGQHIGIGDDVVRSDDVFQSGRLRSMLAVIAPLELFVVHVGHQPTVHDELAAGGVGRLVAGQEQDERRNLAHFARTAQRNGDQVFR